MRFCTLFVQFVYKFVYTFLYSALRQLFGKCCFHLLEFTLIYVSIFAHLDEFSQLCHHGTGLRAWS